jgi:hypothetical protein
MAPKYTPKLHVKELSKELQTNLEKLACKHRNINIMKMLACHLNAYIAGTQLPAPKQAMEQRVAVLPTQRVSDNAHQPTHPNLQRASDTPITPVANNLTLKRVLQTKPRTHQHLTRCNTPLLRIPRAPIIPPLLASRVLSVSTANTNRIRNICMPFVQTPERSSPQRRSTCLNPMSFPRLCTTRIISQEAINHLLMDNLHNDTCIFTPFKLMPPQAAAINFERFAMPMIHPTTGETIRSYKKLMNNPATQETWMMAFGKGFCGMCQGDNKTGQKGTDVMFVMTLANIPYVPTNQTITYANAIVNHCLQIEDLNQIWITAGGNLIN